MTTFDFSSALKGSNLGNRTNTIPSFTVYNSSIRYSTYHFSGAGYFYFNGSRKRLEFTIYGDFDWYSNSLERQRIRSMYYSYQSSYGSFSITNL